MRLIFRYSAQILLDKALLCWQNARHKNRLFCSKFCRQNLSKPSDHRQLRVQLQQICTIQALGTRSKMFVHSTSNWKLEMLVFVEEGKPENNPRSRDENQQQNKPTFDV